MSMNLEIERTFAVRTVRVHSVDLHSTEPWIPGSLDSGYVYMWNYKSKDDEVKSFKVSRNGSPVYCAKFVPNHCFAAAVDYVYINVYNCITGSRENQFQAHEGCIRCLSVHSSVLSSSDDMLIKMWNYKKDWELVRTFRGHSDAVFQVSFNPMDTETFASASIDATVKVWTLDASDPKWTLSGHTGGVNCVDYTIGSDMRLYLITTSNDCTAKVWDYQTKSCIKTLQKHDHTISCGLFHHELYIFITGSKNGRLQIWNTSTSRREKLINYGLGGVCAVENIKGSKRIVIGFEQGIVMVEMNRISIPSMDIKGSIIWSKNTIQTANVNSLERQYQITDGRTLPLVVKELQGCGLYPQCFKHSSDGRSVVICGDN